MPEEKSLEMELQRTKEDLEDLEIYIGEFSAFLPLAVCTVNPVGVIININKATEDLSGYSSLEIVGEPIASIFLEKKEIEKIEQEIVQKELIRERELVLLAKAKKEIPVSVSASIRKDKEGNYIGYFIGLTDITELKKFQEKLEDMVKERTGELEEEKNRTISIVVNLVDGLLVFDKENKLTLVNPQAEVLLDIKSKDVLDKHFLELSRSPFLRPLVEFLGGGIKAVFREEVKFEENLTLEVSSVYLMKGEEKLGTLVVLHDVTREKLVEKLKTEFVTLAAHQLRTPISAIKWILKMMLDEDVGKITPEQKDFIEKAYKSNERMISLINDLLNVTRIEEGRYLYKPTLSSFEETIQPIIDSYKEEIKKRKLKLKLKKPWKKLPLIMADAEKIKIVVQNLLDNAIKYTRPGGKVTFSISCDKKNIEGKVEDTGIGIPKNQQDRVFTKFFRGSNVLRMETEGTGLGLFITKNIVEAHGGKIWFESKEGRGSTFYFTIPLKKEFTEFLTGKFY